MPKLTSRTSTSQADPGPGTIAELALDGFIDAANYEVFEHCLEDAYQAGHRFLVLDFNQVHYINSTGISALIRFDELFRARKGALCLVNVAKPVGLSMHLLGVTSFLPFLKDLEQAREYVRDVCSGKVNPDLAHAPVPGELEEEEPDSDTSDSPPRRSHEGLRSLRRVHFRMRKIPGLEQARVLVITPSKSRFTRVLRLRFKSLNGDYHLLHDIRDALERYEELQPDLVVVDERSDPRGEFVGRVKMQKDRSLTSIIKLYPKRARVESSFDFKIWENDYLVEPFEVLELFTLTEAELLRVPRDKKVFQQQVRFAFRSDPENLEKACKLCDRVIHESLLNQEDATAFYAAVKEGLDNAIVHGNHSERDRKIDVNLLVDKKKVTVIIEDQGEGFDSEYYLSRIDDQEAFEKAKKRILEEGHRGGLGILLMSKCSDRIEYSGSGNVLRLEKNL